jgi:hypothetical protein
MRQEPSIYVNGNPVCARPPNKIGEYAELGNVTRKPRSDLFRKKTFFFKRQSFFISHSSPKLFFSLLRKTAFEKTSALRMSSMFNCPFFLNKRKVYLQTSTSAVLTLYLFDRFCNFVLSPLLSTKINNFFTLSMSFHCHWNLAATYVSMSTSKVSTSHDHVLTPRPPSRPRRGDVFMWCYVRAK